MSDILFRSGDGRLALGGSTACRTMSIGSTWNVLRIAFRFAMTDPGADLTSTPGFFWGVCSGTSNPWDTGSGTTTHAVGLRTIDATWSRVAGSPGYLLCSTNAMRATKRVSTTITDSATATTFYAWYIPVDASAAYNQIAAIQITKGSPNFTIKMFARQNNFDIIDISQDTFLAQMTLTTPTVNRHGWEVDSTLAVDEGANGALDCINFAWDRTSPKFEISDVIVVRFS